jgi:signal transduction histidine kinase
MRSWLFFVLLLCSGFAYGQTSVTVDSLLQKVSSSSTPDTTRTLLYEELALRTMNSDPAKAMVYGNKGLALAKSINYPLGEARNINRVGTILRANGRYADALSNYFQALKISQQLDDKEGVAKIYNSIGILYAEQNNSKLAITYYQKAREIAESIDNDRLIQIFLLNIGTDYAFLNQLDSAQFYTEKAFKLAQNSNSSNINVLLMNLGNINYRKQNFPAALNYYHRSIPLSKVQHDNRMLSQTYFEMARLFKESNQRDSCLLYAKNALTLAEEANNLRYLHQITSLLSELYENSNPKTSLDYFKESMAMRDSLFSIDKATRLRNIGFNEEMRKQELAVLEEKSETNQKIGVLIGLAIGLLLLAFVLYRNNMRKEQVNLLLAQQNQDIEEERNKVEESLKKLKLTQNQLIQSEKLASLGELTAGIAHEIQNPLNFVTNFSEVSIEIIEELEEILNKEHTTTDEKAESVEVLNEIKENQGRILEHGKRASDIVTSMLEHSRGNVGERREIDINKLCDEYVRLSFHGMRAKDKAFNANYILELDSKLPMYTGVSQDIGRVLLNLMNNAFYAVNKRRAGESSSYEPKVVVSTITIGSQFLEIQVKDNGMGMNKEVQQKIFQPFFTTKPTGEGTGLGLSLSYDIITKGNNGMMTVKSEVDSGTTFTIKLPLN